MNKFITLCFSILFVAACLEAPQIPVIEQPEAISLSSSEEMNRDAPVSTPPIYINEKYGFSLQISNGFVEEERDEYIRLQNYTPEEDRMALRPGEYYVEIHTPTTSWGPCSEQIVDGTKVTVGSVSGYKGQPLEVGGDPGGERLALCVETEDQYYYIQVTGESSMNHAILDSFTLIPG